jgi:putative ABC transport system substrate-binding protein
LPRVTLVYLGAGVSSAANRYIDAFRGGLADLGLHDGGNVEIVVRLAENRIERLQGLAEEAVAINPAVIVAGSSDAAVLVKKLTSTIPIISGALADAERLGLVNSYARPGGNVTGVMPYVAGLPAKQIELATEIVPKAKKIGILGNMYDPKAKPQREELTEAATKLGLAVVVPELKGPDDLSNAIDLLASERTDAIVVLETTMLLSAREQVARLISEKGIPAVYGYREHVQAGGLISYGVDLVWCWRRVATFAQRIISGVAPADLPVEFPTKILLAVNLIAAKAIGVTLPPTLITRADEVIE